jgi:hypothetical protein
MCQSVTLMGESGDFSKHLVPKTKVISSCMISSSL